MTQPPDPTALTSRPSADVVLFRRDDLAALATCSRLRARSSQWTVPAIVGSGFLTFFGLIAVQEIGGIAAVTTPICIGAAVAVSTLVTVRASRAERARRAEYSFSCPGCGLDIVSPTPFTEDSPRAELVIATGCCPGCGMRIVAD